MKKLAMLFLMALLVGFQTVVANKPSLRKYGKYSVSDTKAFALENAIYRDTLTSLVHRKLRQAGYSVKLSTDQIFDHVEMQEVWLEAKQWKNSRWTDDSETAIEFYLSESRYEGNAGVFIYEECSFPLWKESCDNFFDASLNGVSKTKHTVLVPDTIRNTPTKHDTIFHHVWVEEPREREQQRVQVVYMNQGYGLYEPVYYRPMYMPLFIPWFSGWNRGGNNYTSVNINNSSYYYNNQNTNIRNDYHQSQPSNSCGPTPGYGGANTAGEVRNGGNGNYNHNNGGYNGNGNQNNNNGNGYQGRSRSANVRVSTISEQNSQQFRTRQSGNQNFEKSATVNQNNQNRTSNSGYGNQNQNVRTSQSRQSDNQSGQFNYGRPSQSSQTSQSRQSDGQVRQSNYGAQNQTNQMMRTRQSSNQNLKSASMNQQSSSTNYNNQTRSSNYNSGQVRSSGYSGGQQRSASVYNGGSQSRPSSGGSQSRSSSGYGRR